MSALKRVEIKDNFNRIMRKEQKAAELCRAMRDCVEALEDALKDSKVKMLLYFWRNKNLKALVMEQSC